MTPLIRSFADKDTRAIFHRAPVPRFRAFENAARRKLRLLHRARSLHDLAGPGLGLEALKHERKGQYSIRINRKYRVCFTWEDGDARDVEITDYH